MRLLFHSFQPLMFHTLRESWPLLKFLFSFGLKHILKRTLGTFKNPGSMKEIEGSPLFFTFYIILNISLSRWMIANLHFILSISSLYTATYMNIKNKVELYDITVRCFAMICSTTLCNNALHLTTVSVL